MIRSVHIGIAGAVSVTLKRINSGRYDFVGGKPVADFYNTNSACVGFKNPFDYRSGFGIGNDLFRIGGVFHISVWNCSAHSLSALAFRPLNCAYLLARIACVQVVKVVLDRKSVV